MNMSFKDYLKEGEMLPCPKCDGGYTKQGDKCGTCKGRGEASADRIAKDTAGEDISGPM